MLTRAFNLRGYVPGPRGDVNAHFITRLLNGAFTHVILDKRPNSSGIRSDITGK